jgi:hypothetical protein
VIVIDGKNNSDDGKCAWQEQQRQHRRASSRSSGGIAQSCTQSTSVCQGQGKILPKLRRRSDSGRLITNLEYPMVVRSKSKQEERAEEEIRPQSSNRSAKD